jgi:hypothetical protein
MMICMVAAQMLLDFVQTPRQLGVNCKNPPQPKKCSHDLDVHEHGPLAAEHAG